MSEAVLVLDFTLLGLWLLLVGLRYLVRRDRDEARRNREDACTYHGWVRSAAGRLSCRLCGKTPSLEEGRWREDFA